jgi:hypothetical protein
MPQSRNRGGTKAHNKRVKQRNQKAKKALQEYVNKAYDKFEEWKKQKNEDTDNGSFRDTTGNG